MVENQAKVREATFEDAPVLVEYAILMAKETEDKDLNRATATYGIEHCL